TMCKIDDDASSRYRAVNIDWVAYIPLNQTDALIIKDSTKVSEATGQDTDPKTTAKQPPHDVGSDETSSSQNHHIILFGPICRPRFRASSTERACRFLANSHYAGAERAIERNRCALIESDVEISDTVP